MTGQELSPVQRTSEVVDPITGSLVDLADTALALEFLSNLRDTRQAYLDLIKRVEAYLAEEMGRQGTGTLNAGRWVGERGTKVEYQWDEEVLHELVDAGLPEERYGQLVEQVVSVKVRQNVAKQLEAANPAYKEIIQRARRTIEKPASIDVRPSKEVARGE